MLSDIMNYRHEGVIQRYMLEHDAQRETAEKLFHGLLQYLAVCVLTNGRRTPSSEIDEMWHAFILHMRDYEFFCHHHLRQTVYHDPALDDSGFKFYPMTRDCVAALFGEPDETIWPTNHKRYTRCISCSPAPANLFRDCLAAHASA